MIQKRQNLLGRSYQTTNPKILSWKLSKFKLWTWTYNTQYHTFPNLLYPIYWIELNWLLKTKCKSKLLHVFIVCPTPKNKIKCITRPVTKIKNLLSTSQHFYNFTFSFTIIVNLNINVQAWQHIYRFTFTLKCVNKKCFIVNKYRSRRPSHMQRS